MARTWPVTRSKRLALGVFDAVMGPLTWPFLKRRTRFKQHVERILVLELWHMGDVVIATSALKCLRRMYPRAEITLLAKDHARELLDGHDAVDEIITFDFPWTATEKKYSPSRYDRRAMSAIVKQLREKKFDISVDCRMDLRSNVLTRAIGARRRVGYDFGGGSFLLTDTLAAPPAQQHKVDDWRALVSVLDAWSPRRMPRGVEPALEVSDAERKEARHLLDSFGIAQDEIVVGVHPGGSHEAKRWASEHFAEVARELQRRYNVRVLVFVDPNGYGSNMSISNAAFVRTSIREMMALFTQSRMVLCNDSGPMHIAAAVGTPVVAVFRTGDPDAYGPRGLGHTVVGKGAPWGRTTDISVEDVLDAADAAVASLA
jgi:ADP-heptose:LPS heptosyltransferase